MDYTDDEAEDFPEFVSNYCFEDEDRGCISFSVLPIIWNASESMQDLKTQIYIRGTTDDGLQTIFKPVKAWKFDLSGEKPEISVLSKDNWMKLQKPKKAFEADIRTVLITVSFLHLVKKNPQLNDKVIWRKLSRIFSSYDVRPSENDLGQCKEIIKEAVKQEVLLTKSEYLMTFLGEKPQKKKKADEDVLSKEKREFIVDEDEDDYDAEDVSDDSSEEEDGDEEPFDSVCCICDNGGSLLCCEGSCMRSFHATEKAADDAESLCESLGFSEKEVKAMPNFKCANCLHKIHQCFACGQLGSSDKSSNTEVFQCVNATCGYFYHPHCVAKLLHRDSEAAAKELQDKISAGDSFTCPLHLCIQCKKPEDKSITEMQMAVCRRCPKAYHEKCLPRKISFEENEKLHIEERAWKGLLVNRILIYCLKHEIDESLGTPKRNHIKFPGDKTERQSLGATDQTGTATKSKKKAVMDNYSDKRTDQKRSKLKGSDISSCPTEKLHVLTKVGASRKAEYNKTSTLQLVPVRPNKSSKLFEGDFTKTSKPSVKMVVPQLDSNSEKRLLALIEEASSIITLDDVIDNHKKVINARTYKQKIDRNKTITQGKVDASCEAVRAAIKKLKAGGTLEGAKGICEPEVLHQVSKWKNALRVYLAPFLYGMRYTSYGRHFTNIDKLKEIVDKIHWYVNNDDTVVDFCCGANDFSWLMKQKLEETRKNCFFKNYDLFPPKNDFNFEERDWMTVQRHELPPGKQLIMGLNPPFGVKAALANQFIDKALQFQPKLIILIVPPETKRLDEKKIPYDLIWEDTEKLSGKSFYLPGSVDVSEKQIEDWNVVAPVLYLWSHPDFTNKHKAIAEKHGHILGRIESHSKSIRSANKPLLKKRVGDSSFKSKQQVKDVSVDTEVARSSPKLYISEEKLKETAPSAQPTEDLEDREERHVNETQGSNSKHNKESSSRKRSHSEEKQPIRRSVEDIHPPNKRWKSPPNNPDLGSRYSSPFQGGRHSSEREREGYSSIQQGTLPSSNVVDPTYDHIEHATTTYEPSYVRERHYETQASYPQAETDPYLSGTGRWPPPGAHPRVSELYAFNTLQPEPPEMSYYSMESNYNRTNYVPATERYNLGLGEQNRGTNVGPHTPNNPGVDQYNYQDPRVSYLGDPHVGYRPGPGHYDRYPPYN